ncbi:MAG: response regulator [Vulcanimicrobiota bacterium]
MRDIQILIAEDEAIVALSLKLFIEKIGYHVPATAFSGKEIVDKALKIHPDLVILDIRLNGEIDGIEAGRQIRDKLGTPLIYLTACSDNATLKRASDTLPCAFLKKPFDESEVQTAIHLACRHMRPRNRPQQRID